MQSSTTEASPVADAGVVVAAGVERRAGSTVAVETVPEKMATLDDVGEDGEEGEEGVAAADEVEDGNVG
jgi:hypothetical protein